MVCEECKGRVGNPFWTFQYGYRPGQEPKGPIRKLVHPKAFHACDVCVAKIPEADRKPSHGRLGLKTGRVVFLDRFKESYVEGHWGHSNTDPARGYATVFLSVSMLHRRLPKLMARMIKADQQRMTRAKKELKRPPRR